MAVNKNQQKKGEKTACLSVCLSVRLVRLSVKMASAASKKVLALYYASEPLRMPIAS